MATPFVDDRLPDDIERGRSGGPRFKTIVTDLDSGNENRTEKWSRTRARYDIGYGLQKLGAEGAADGLRRIYNFFMARRGRAVAFRFHDHADFQIGFPDPQFLATGDGVTNIFQIFKRYSTAGGFYDRKITKIVTATVVLYTQDGENDPVVFSGDYAVDLATGIITIDPDEIAALEDLDILVQAEYDVPVRFESDEWVGVLELMVNDETSAASVPRIPVIEVRV